MNSFKIMSVNVSSQKGEVKTPVEKIVLKEQFGIIGDAHAGEGPRQVSLLAQEDIDTIVARGMRISYGDFAENITTLGIDLASLPIGSNISIDRVVLEVTQIGKECHNRCAIYEKTGDCVMPSRGIFTKVIKGGEVNDKSIGTYYL
ncbi:MOSC domain-containing protein [Fibrobacterota bacterium]